MCYTAVFGPAATISSPVSADTSGTWPPATLARRRSARGSSRLVSSRRAVRCRSEEARGWEADPGRPTRRLGAQMHPSHRSRCALQRRHHCRPAAQGKHEYRHGINRAVSVAIRCTEYVLNAHPDIPPYSMAAGTPFQLSCSWKIHQCIISRRDK